MRERRTDARRGFTDQAPAATVRQHGESRITALPADVGGDVNEQGDDQGAENRGDDDECLVEGVGLFRKAGRLLTKPAGVMGLLKVRPADAPGNNCCAVEMLLSKAPARRWSPSAFRFCPGAESGRA